MVKKGCCRASVFALLVGTLLQIGAIAAPGWFIFITGNVEAYRSVFYAVKCTVQPENECKLKMYKDIYSDRRDVLVRLKVGQKKLAAHDHEYNEIFYKEVVLVVAACLSTLSLLTQACRKGSVEKRHQRKQVICIVFSALSAGMVLSVIAGDFVELLYESKLMSLDGRVDHTYMGFPYSVVMMLVSIVMHLIATVTMGAHLNTGKDKKKRSRASYIEYAEPPAKQAPKQPAKQAAPIETKYAYDNKILSEKL